MRVPDALLAVAFGLLAFCGVALTVGISAALLVFLWLESPWLFAALTALVAVAVLYARRDRAPEPFPLPPLQRAPRLHAIRPGGAIGLVFVIGYLFMFLGALPSFLPVAAGVFALGVLGGVLLITVRARRRRRVSASILGFR